MIRVGAVDCGTNSIRLLIADLDPAGGALIEIRRELEIVRLGHGVDRTGLINAEAMARTLAVVQRYARTCADLGVQRVRFVGTSASRDARNADEFIDGVRRAFAPRVVTPEVISGAQEAQLSFTGATAALPRAGTGETCLVVDLGGGSTELVLGPVGSQHPSIQVYSADVGSVRLTERHLHDDPPGPQQVAGAIADVDAGLEQAARILDLGRVDTLLGLAGTVTTVTAFALGLPEYDRRRIHLNRMPTGQVVAACAQLLSMTAAQRAACPVIHPGRVDVIAAGALVWRQVIARVVAAAGIDEVVTCEHDILDGIALSLA